LSRRRANWFPSFAEIISPYKYWLKLPWSLHTFVLGVL